MLANCHKGQKQQKTQTTNCSLLNIVFFEEIKSKTYYNRNPNYSRILKITQLGNFVVIQGYLLLMDK